MRWDEVSNLPSIALGMFDNCDFTQLTDRNFVEKVVDRIVYTAPFEKDKVDIQIGASKMVLIFDNLDVVIKIPFTGYDVFGELLERSVWEGCHRIKAPVWGPRLYTPFEHAQSDNGWDYCEVEEAVYWEAKQFDVSEFFAYTRCIGRSRGGHPIYIQDKIERLGLGRYTEMDRENKFTEEEKIAAQSISENTTDELSWLAVLAAVRDYGITKTEAFMQFIVDAGIDDLHGHNIGVLNGRFVLIDYSCYND